MPMVSKDNKNKNDESGKKDGKKDEKEKREKGRFQTVVIVCPRCKEVKEVCGIAEGLLTFKEYYCCVGVALEIHAPTITPN